MNDLQKAILLLLIEHQTKVDFTQLIHELKPMLDRSYKTASLYSAFDRMESHHWLVSSYTPTTPARRLIQITPQGIEAVKGFRNRFTPKLMALMPISTNSKKPEVSSHLHAAIDEEDRMNLHLIFESQLETLGIEKPEVVSSLASLNPTQQNQIRLIDSVIDAMIDAVLKKCQSYKSSDKSFTPEDLYTQTNSAIRGVDIRKRNNSPNIH
jgi:DNA-binding PadR family transcriptional regulator